MLKITPEKLSGYIHSEFVLNLMLMKATALRTDHVSMSNSVKEIQESLGGKFFAIQSQFYLLLCNDPNLQCSLTLLKDVHMLLCFKPLIVLPSYILTTLQHILTSNGMFTYVQGGCLLHCQASCQNLLARVHVGSCGTNPRCNCMNDQTNNNCFSQ